MKDKVIYVLEKRQKYKGGYKQTHQYIAKTRKRPYAYIIDTRWSNNINWMHAYVTCNVHDEFTYFCKGPLVSS